MTVLVTGATGFTGGALAQKLCELGKNVRVLVRDKEKLNLPAADDMEVFEGDIVDNDIVAKAVKGVDTIFHIAALFRQANIPSKIYDDVNIKGTENLLIAGLKNDVQKFVHCSTIGVHGHIENPPANENYRYSPGD